MSIDFASSFLNGVNAAYISELYARFAENPDGVDQGWSAFFEALGEDGRQILEESKAPFWGLAAAKTDEGAANGAMIGNGVDPKSVKRDMTNVIRGVLLIRAYRTRGHLRAKLDPLDMQERAVSSELDYRTYGFVEDDLDRPVFVGNMLANRNIRDRIPTLRQVISVLNETYCGSVGVEFMHVLDPEQKVWIRDRIEPALNRMAFGKVGKRIVLSHLTQAECFEKFLKTKYPATKRFGLEGGEALIPLVEQIMRRSVQLGMRSVVIGMAHRGRLNVLTNVVKKPFAAVFSEFQGGVAMPEDVLGSGDVKYHLGTTTTRNIYGSNVQVALTSNPSHLEAVDPVVLGKVRAKQIQAGNGEDAKDRILGLLIHGDAAFAGQGMVAECFAMSHLEGYGTGGTIHLIVNNQIGFTTMPRYSRSGPYCTDMAKMASAPIFHVNGDDVEAVIHVANIASEFRQKYKTDVVIDMVCYRRHGHNEGDEPGFTQPLMYDRIANHPTVREIYAKTLIEDGVITKAEADEMVAAFMGQLDDAFEAAKTYKVGKADWLEGKWAGLGVLPDEEDEICEDRTDVSDDLLAKVGAALTRTPVDFNLNPKIVRQLDAKKQMMESGQGIDWATAEALAFGALLAEGTPVRLSGQDSARGTFSQRHSVLVDQKTEERFIPLANIAPDQAQFQVVDSLLSELAVLGFEFGYSLTSPHALVLWEAQFGDFANGAQMIIDQFISSSESKWLRMSGLTLLLPHGYEGQGPEHSSARLERYLQLCAEDNMQVCNLTTPANYFHALRRQIRRNFRRPLIVMTPKSLLRHKLAVSPLADFGPASRFHRVIPESPLRMMDKTIRRIIFCSGKVYYDLFEERERLGLNDVTIVRIEQLYPWPTAAVEQQIARYPDAEIVWCQEEPSNMGAWVFVDRRLEYAMENAGSRHRRPVYAGRWAAASPATGVYKKHLEEQAKLVKDALTANLADLNQPFKKATKMSEMQSRRKGR